MTAGDEVVDASREAFSLLGHEVRLDILLALLEGWLGERTEPRSYSELMGAVGLEDSGKFNYHLDKLRGTYVRKVDDGYVPLASSTALYRAVLANRPTAEPPARTFAVDSSCPECDADLLARYEREFLSVRCPDCEETVGEFTYPVPKNGLTGRTDTEVVRAAHRRARYHVNLARTGQCPFCAGRTAVDLATDRLFHVAITCDTCSFVVGSDLPFVLGLDRRVAVALARLDVPADAYRWELPDTTAREQDSDPRRVAVELSNAGRTATIVVDDDLTVHSVSVDGAPVELADDS